MPKKTFFNKLINLKDEQEEAEDENGSLEKTTNQNNEVANQDQVWQTSEEEGQLSVDVYQTGDNVVIKSTIAGVKPEDLDVAINNDMVTIKGKRYQEEKTKESDYFYQECYWGSFSRSIILPIEVIADKAEAGLKNGVLTITIPKAKKSQSVAVKVKTD